MLLRKFPMKRKLQHDFGELVYNQKKEHRGILLLRPEDAVAEEKLACIQNIIPAHVDDLKNKLSVYQNGKLRTRIIQCQKLLKPS